MKAVQDALYASADTIDSQEQFENEVDAELQKIREDMDLTISMIGRTLYQVPFQVFKTPKKQQAVSIKYSCSHVTKINNCIDGYTKEKTQTHTGQPRPLVDAIINKIYNLITEMVSIEISTLGESLSKSKRNNNNSRTLYYIGKRPASPKPKPERRWMDAGQPGDVWVREWLDKLVKKAVFLTPEPLSVGIRHGVWGHVYAYSVPEWVINKAAGLHRFDKVTEIVILDDLWKHVKFLGKSMDEGEFDKKMEKAESKRTSRKSDLGYFLGKERESQKENPTNDND